MGALSLVSGLLGCAALAWPRQGKFVALALGLFAMGVGLLAVRRQDRGRARLLAAGGVTVGALVSLIAGAKVALTIAAVDHLGGLLGS
jgi:hypothetical protein